MEISDANVCYSPQDISAGMLKRPPTNLNKQSEEATVTLIREILDQGIELSEVYPCHFYRYCLYLTMLYCILAKIDAISSRSMLMLSEIRRHTNATFPACSPVFNLQ